MASDARFTTEEKRPIDDDEGFDRQPQRVDLPPAYSAPAQPNPQWPPAPQPEQVVLLPPNQATPAIPSRRHRKKIAICGTVLIICALVLCIATVIIAIKFGTRPAAFYYVATPLTLVTGMMGIVAARKGSKSTIIASMVLSIVSAVVDVWMFMFAATTWFLFEDTPRQAYEASVEADIALFAVTTVTCFVAATAVIVQASYGCALACRCCKTRDPQFPVQYYVQGGQGGQAVTLVPAQVQAAPGQSVALIPAQSQVMMTSEGQSLPYQTVMVAQAQTVAVQRI